MFNPIGSKATVCAFTLTPNVIITGHESGKVALFNVKTGEEVDNNERAHSDVVTDLQLSKDRTYCITSSKDKAARVCFTRPYVGVALILFSSDTRYEKPHGDQDLHDRNTTEQCGPCALSALRESIRLGDCIMPIDTFLDPFGRGTGSNERNDNIPPSG